MPTTRPRHQITETDEIAEAIDAGLREWPDLSRSDVIRELIVKGADALNLSAAERVLAFELALKQLEDLDIQYPPNYLDEVRRGWGRYD
jgi:hypothetical protein